MPAEKQTGHEERKIGARLRQLRQDSGLTLALIARQTGISVSTISKIENNKVSPTFANLLKLSEAFGVSLSRMIGDEDNGTPPTTARIAVTRATDIAFTRTKSYEMGPLCTDLRNKRMSPFLDVISASATGGGDMLVRHSGEEFVYVLEGELEIHTEHYEPISLSPGDCAYYDSQMAHAFRSAGKKCAKILTVWLPPEGTDHENVQKLIRQITRHDLPPPDDDGGDGSKP